jgi:hypothetical protein
MFLSNCDDIGHYKLTFDVYDHDGDDKSEIIGTCRLDGKELLAAAKAKAAIAAAIDSKATPPVVAVTTTTLTDVKEEKKLIRAQSSIVAAHLSQMHVWVQLEPPVVKVCTI